MDHEKSKSRNSRWGLWDDGLVAHRNFGPRPEPGSLFKWQTVSKSAIFTGCISASNQLLFSASILVESFYSNRWLLSFIWKIIPICPWKYTGFLVLSRFRIKLVWWFPAELCGFSCTGYGHAIGYNLMCGINVQVFFHILNEILTPT